MNWLKENKWFVGCFAVLLVYLSPNWLFLDSAQLQIHDNLDSNVVWYHNLGESGLMFSDNLSILPCVMNGIPRGCYPSELNFNVLGYYLFNYQTAYHLNAIILHLCAFFGMFYLLKNFIVSKELNWMLSLSFALLPFWPSGGLSIAGMPLMMAALYSLSERKAHVLDWAIVIIYPLHSTIFFSGLFFIAVIFCWLLYLLITRRKLPVVLLIGVALYCILSVVADYRLFLMQMNPEFKNHRTYISQEALLNWKGMLGVGTLHFLSGQYHAHSIHFFILLTGIVSLFIIRDKTYWKQTVLFLGCVFLVSLTVSFAKSLYYEEYFPAIKNIGVQLRFYTLFPALWYCYFAWITYKLHQHFNGSKKVLALVGVQSLILLFSVYTRDFYGNTEAENAFYYTYCKNDELHADLNTFYKKDVFNKVKEHLKDYKASLECFGFPTECAQINGFPTYGAYHYYYPLEKGKTWQKINYKELVKAYGPDKIGMPRQLHLVSSELLKGASVVNNLELDFAELKTQNCFYILSRVQINSPALEFDKEFTSDTDHLYLYKII
jgi:hypothetical protein